MFDKRHIGHRFDPYTVEVEKGAIRLFAKAIGERNPVHTDEATARAAGYRSLLAPPTFVFTLEGLNPTPWPALRLLGVAEGEDLHGEQAFEFLAPVCAGDRLTLSDEITDIYAKKGGLLDFVVTRTEVRNQAGELVAVMRSTGVVKRG